MHSQIHEPPACAPLLSHLFFLLAACRPAPLGRKGTILSPVEQRRNEQSSSTRRGPHAPEVLTRSRSRRRSSPWRGPHRSLFEVSSDSSANLFHALRGNTELEQAVVRGARRNASNGLTGAVEVRVGETSVKVCNKFRWDAR